jgi:hypothetical protein
VFTPIDLFCSNCGGRTTKMWGRCTVAGFNAPVCSKECHKELSWRDVKHVMGRPDTSRKAYYEYLAAQKISENEVITNG